MAVRTQYWVFIMATILLTGCQSPAILSEYQAPTTEYGQPDFQGVWNFSSNIPLQRVPEFSDRAVVTPEEMAEYVNKAEKRSDFFLNFGVGFHNKFWLEDRGQLQDLRTSLITYPENGKVPSLQDGVKKISGRSFVDVQGTRPVRFSSGGIGKDGPEDRGLSERCLVGGNSGPPVLPGGDNNNLQIFQDKNHVVILSEYIHDARIIPLYEKPPLDDRIKRWSGDSRGHWEGDTLVVTTRNFNDLTQSFDESGVATHKVVTERFTRVGENILRYEARIEDPYTFTDKIEIMIPMARGSRIFEFACHEGNYSMGNILAGARAEEAEEAQ